MISQPSGSTTRKYVEKTHSPGKRETLPVQDEEDEKQNTTGTPRGSQEARYP